MWFWIGLGFLVAGTVVYFVGRLRGEIRGYGRGYLDGYLQGAQDWLGKEAPDAA